MKYYINKNKEFFGFELDGSQDHLITEDMKPISLEEIQTINDTRQEEYKQTAEYKIAEAKQFLDKSDKKVLPYYEFEDGDSTLEWYIEERSKARKFIRDNQ